MRGWDEQLITAVTGDAAPDVIRLDLTWVPQMAKLGALECLNDYAGFDDISAGIMPGSMSTTLYKGQNYGLPLNANTTVAVYNNAVLQEYGFDAPPETLDALMGALDKTNPAEEKWLFAVSGSYNWAMLPFIWTLGGSVTDGDYTTASGYLNGADTVKALDTIVGWYKDGVIGPAIMGEQPDGWGGIEAGNYTMIVEGPWFFSSEDKLDTYTPALMPSVDGRSISIVGGEDIVMTSTSSKKGRGLDLYEVYAGGCTAGCHGGSRYDPGYFLRHGKGGYQRFAICRGVYGTAEDGAGADPVLQLADHRDDPQHCL